jgi:hypothetical protein
VARERGIPLEQLIGVAGARRARGEEPIAETVAAGAEE